MARSAQDPDPLQHGPGRTRSGAQFATGPPATPKIHRVEPAIDINKLTFRRVARDVPFYGEEGVDRDGPLDQACGLLHDLAQIFEALNFGFRGQQPLANESISEVVSAIIQPISTPGEAQNNFDPIINAVTDFDYLSFLVAQTAEDAGTPLLPQGDTMMGP